MRDQAYQAVCNAFGRYFEVHPTRVQAHHDLRNDWGLDASELTLVAEHIQETAGVELDDPGELGDVHTVGQLVHLVRKHMKRAAQRDELKSGSPAL